MTKISFEIPAELHRDFKKLCAEDGCSITDTVKDFVQQVVDGAKEDAAQPQVEPEKESQKTVVIDGKAVVDDLDSNGFNAPANPTPVESAAAAQAIEKVVEVLTTLVPTVTELVQWRENFHVWQDFKFAEVDKKFSEADHKFVVAGRLVDSAITAIEQLHSGVKRGADDVKGFALLKGESVEAT